MVTTGPYSYKKYQCTQCGLEQEHGTNHWGEIYPYCPRCMKTTVWVCLEKMPKGYEKPEPWKMAILRDIADVKQKRR